MSLDVRFFLLISNTEMNITEGLNIFSLIIITITVVISVAQYITDKDEHIVLYKINKMCT